MVSVCLPSDAILQHLPSYLGFSYLGRCVSLHGCSSKAQPLLLTLDEGYLLTTALPDLQHGIAPLGPLAPTQPRLLGPGVVPSGHRPLLWAQGGSSWRLPLASGMGWLLSAAAPDLGLGYLLSAIPKPSQPGTLGHYPSPWILGNSSWPLPFGHGVLPASAPDLGRGVAPLGHA